ncbi:MAG TPA: GNAT family N-acyltransferase [Terriglobales bacterium]
MAAAESRVAEAAPAAVNVRLSALEQFFFLRPLRKVYDRVRQPGSVGLMERLLREMRIEVRVAPDDLARIPQTGAALVVANHPFGILDGAVLASLLPRVRPDVKLFTNYMVGAVEELADLCIYLDPFDRASAHRVNVSGLRQAISHLKNGGLLAMFPAGEVSYWQFRHGEVTDPDWSPTVARLARLTRATVVPVLFAGRNSIRYHLLGAVHSRLRTIQLPQELLNKTGKDVELRVGTPVSAEKLCRIVPDQQATNYLRWRTYLLRQRPAMAPATALQPGRRQQAVLPPLDREAVADEIGALGPQQELDENREFRVYVSDASRVPRAMLEIGRQRELAFREAGEGTGKEFDLDGFDVHYQHLILWHRKDQQIAGGYRFANTAQVLPHHGLAGLYTNTLFWIDPVFFERTGPAMELGRSFVRREYQKQYSALLTLWKGLGRYLATHPETPVLFGPVSISSTYRRRSRELLVEYFRSRRANPLSEWIRPRRPFRSSPLPDWQLRAIRYLLDLEEMSCSIAEIEGDGKGVPVLLRQYLKIGGELLAFNVDKDFSDALDGLVLVDLRRTDPTRLETYMGKDGVSRFLEHHGALATSR